jgi:hypothetical protein
MFDKLYVERDNLTEASLKAPFDVLLNPHLLTPDTPNETAQVHDHRNTKTPRATGSKDKHLADLVHHLSNPSDLLRSVLSAN